MALVYSYMRFSDPPQGAGSPADRQAEDAHRRGAERGLVRDESLSRADHGLSAYHQRHVKVGALGVFLRAVEDGRIEAGSVLIVEGLDRLSRAEPLQAQAQLTSIIHAGITVVTAADGQEYSRDAIKANPYKLIHSLVVMIRAHEESDTKSKRVRAAIRRQCEGWIAGTWRSIIRNGKDPHWVKWNGSAFELVPERAEAVRFAVRRFLDGLGAVSIVREMAARGLAMTEAGALNSNGLYKTLRKRLLVGDRDMEVAGEAYRLAGYYPPLITADEFDRLQLAIDRRQGKRGVGEIPSILTGMGIAQCGYCGAAMVSQNIMGRKRQADGKPWPGHRRITCTSNAKGGGCPVPGSVQAAPVELALMLYAADGMRMAELVHGGDHGQALRAGVAAARRRLADAEAKLKRLADALAEDDGPTPLTIIRQMRTIEAEAEACRAEIERAERELSGTATPTPDMAEKWMGLIERVVALETEARMEARELVRASFARFTIWHQGDPVGGDVMDIELTAGGGGVTRFRVDRATGGMIDG